MTELSATQQVNSIANRPSPNSPSPLNIDGGLYTTIGTQRPLSAIGSGVGDVVLNAIKAKVPGPAASLITSLQKIIPRGNLNGSDLLRVEATTTIKEKATVVHLKLNVAQLAKLGAVDRNKVFDALIGSAGSAAQVAEIRQLKNMFDSGVKKPGFADSHFAKFTDLRVTFDVPQVNGFRVGMMTLPVVGISKKGWVAVVAVSPRLKFDAAGKLSGGQLIVALEADTPDIKAGGLWAGIGAYGVVSWKGDASNSPIRKDAKGNLGIEMNVDGAVKFVAVPYLKDSLKYAGLKTAENFRLSSAPAVTAEFLAKNVLHTDKPEVAQALTDAAALAKKTGDVISTSQQVVGTVLQWLPLVTAATEFVSLGTILSVAAPALAFAMALPWGGMADGTMVGYYKHDVKTANKHLIRVNALLNKASPLTPDERKELNSVILKIDKLGSKWNSPSYKADYDHNVPVDKRFPWNAQSVETLLHWARQHR